MLGVLRSSSLGRRFALRPIASNLFCRNAAAAATESPPEDIVGYVLPTDEDNIALTQLNEVLLAAKDKKQPPSEALASYDGPFTLEGVSRSLHAHRNPAESRAILEWASRRPGFYYTSRLVNSTVRGLHIGGHLDEARKLLFEEIEGKFKLTLPVLTALAKHYYHAKRMDDFQEIVDEIQKRGMDPDDSLIRLNFERKLKESGVTAMLELFRQKLETGWIPAPFIADQVMSNLFRAGMKDEALEVYNAVRAKGGHPNETSSFMVITAFLSDKKYDEAAAVCKRMMQDEVTMNTPPFKSVLNALCHARKLDEAYELFQVIHEKLPSTREVILVEALCRASKLELALDVLGKLKSPTFVQYRPVICLLCKKGRLEEAKKLVDQLLEAGLSPDADICNSLAEAYAATLPEDDSRRRKFAAAS